MGIKALVERTLEKLGFVTMKNWASVFSRAQEGTLFSNQLTRPYEQIPSVYKAVKALCDNVPQAELITREMKSQEEIENPNALAVLDLLNKPNPLQSQNDFIQETVGIYALEGEVMILKMTSLGQLAGTRNLPAELHAYSRRDAKKIKEGKRIVAFMIDGNSYPPEQVIHIKDFSPYSKTDPTSPDKPLQNLMDLDWLTGVYNKAFFDNGATPPFAITTEKNLTDAQRTRFTQDWNDQFKGAKKQHKTALLEAGMKPVPFGVSHKDMDFLEQKKYTREEILGNWRAPKALFNITDDLNYATFQGQMKVFWLYGILPILGKISDALNRHLVWAFDPSIYVEFDTRNVPAFQEDLQSKITSAKDLFAIGVPLNDINEKLDLGFDEYPWGETWWMPFSLQDVNQANLPPDPATEIPPAEEDPKDDEAKKSKSRFDVKKAKAWKNWESKQAPVEKKFQKAVNRFIFELRKKALEGLYSHEKAFPGLTEKKLELGISWAQEALDLIKESTPYIYASMMEGVAFGKDMIDGPGVNMDLLKSRVMAQTQSRVRRMNLVTNTISKELTKQMDAGLVAGETVNQIADRIRHTFNVAGNRSMTIARTETSGAVNDGSLLYYTEVGVKQVEWITAHDEYVRKSHHDCESAGPVDIGKTFPNGLRYPGDAMGSPAETCNCRCTLAPA